MRFLNDWGTDLMSLGSGIRNLKTFGETRTYLKQIKTACDEMEAELDILQEDQKRRRELKHEKA